MGIEPTTRRRTGLLPFLFLACMAALLAKLAHLQLRDETWDFRERAGDPIRLHHEELPARRGTIYTRNLTPIAITVDRKMVTANPRVKRDRLQVSQELSRLLDIPPKQALELLSRTTQPNGKPNYHVRLARLVRDDVVDLLEPKAAGVRFLTYEYTKYPGVYLRTWYRRSYPFDAFASRVLGRVKDDGTPSGGLEERYQEVLAGKKGHAEYEVDARGHAIPNGHSKVKPARQGASLVLTLDEHIQRATETALQKSVDNFGAKFACAVVLHPPTGNVLAWAGAPSYNPNRIKPDDVQWMNNWPVRYVFEPGSTLKPLIAAAVVDHLPGWERQTHNCAGVMKLQNRDKHCWILAERGHGHGPQTLSEGIANSCNIAMMRFGMQLSPKTLYANFAAFGLLKPTGCDVPSERTGELAAATDWSVQKHADVCYGQGVSATPLQVVAALSAIANGGRLVTPRLVSHILDESGRAAPVAPPRKPRRVVSERAATAVTDMMVRCVEEGTGKRIQIPGVRVAGKTGSAQIAERGGYARGRYICTFVGFAPAEAPRACVLVVVVEPKTSHWGSEVCGPTVKSILQEALLHTEIRPVGAPLHPPRTSA